MNPYVYIDNEHPRVLPQPVKGPTRFAFSRNGHTYYFDSLDEVKAVAAFYRALAWAGRKTPRWHEAVTKTAGPVSSAIQRDRDAVTNLVDRQRFQGSSAWSREESAQRPQPRVLTERIAPEDRATPKPDPEEEV